MVENYVGECYNSSMYKLKPFPFSFLVLGLLIILHTVGSYLFWYWAYPGYDILVHIVSGLWVALVILWLAIVLGQINSLREYKIKTFLIAFVSAILVGVVWELVENLSQVTFVNAAGYYLNTAIDIVSDGAGGILAYLYFIQRKKGERSNRSLLPTIFDQTRLTVTKI